MTLAEGTKANGWKLEEENSGSTRAFPDNWVVQQENGWSQSRVGSQVLFTGKVKIPGN